MDLIIERLSGQSYTLSEYRIKTLDFVVDSPEARADSETAEGLDGFIDLGATLAGRTMHGEFLMDAGHTSEYTKLRNEVFRIFQSREAFYLRDEREAGRRWLVRVDGVFSPAQVIRYARFTVDFVAASPYAESVAGSLDAFKYHEYPLAALVQGAVLPADLNYRHTTASFRVYNPGDVAVDPRTMPFTITYKGASTNIQIRNTTTLDTWAYTGSTVLADRLAIVRTRSLKNDVVPIFGSTNRKLITLAPGWNDFTLTGATGSYEIAFDFRYYTI